MTIDDWLTHQHITEDNVDEYIERNSHSWYGMGSKDFNYGCSPKGVEINNPWDADHQKFTWSEIRNYVKTPKQITLW